MKTKRQISALISRVL